MYQEVMTTCQLAKYLQLDEQTVYRKARRGEIPAVHIGKILRFKKDVIDGWLRISSLKWASSDRESLREWGTSYAKKSGLKEEDIIKAISRRRHTR
jgi:excisionase family DNA binding protein